MKKILIIAAAVLAFAGCTKEAAQVERVTIDGKEYMTFKVVAHDDVVSADTKATLTRGGVFGWSDGEPIYFVASGGAMATGVYNASAGTITVESGDWMCASNAPFDSDSKIKDFGLAKGPVVWAKVESSTLNFYHIGSVINIKFNNIPIDGYLEFWPNGEENWAGGNFGFDSNGVPELSSGGTDPIYIKRPITTEDSGKDISLTVPNINYTGGFTVALSGTTAQYFQQSTSKGFNLSTLPTLLNMQEVSISLPSYTIAGQTYFTAPDYSAEAGVLGEMWNPAETANDMNLDADGLYKKTYTNAPNGISFKIAKDHSWGEAWPDSDKYVGIVCVNGEMTISFNAVTKVINVTSRDLSYTVLGDAGLFDIGWDVNSVENEMKEVAEGVFYKKITSVDPGTYEFKVLANHDSNWNRSWGYLGGGSNFSLTTSSTGDVDIYFYKNNGFVRVAGFSDTFRVAGSSITVFGTSWDANNDANLMTIQNDGIYKITYDITADENIEYKITRDGSWWSGGTNETVSVVNGDKLTIFFNPVNSEISVSKE